MERDYDYSSTLHGADLDPPEKVGRTAGERTVERLNPRKVKSKRVPVVFDRRVAGSLVGHLASAISAHFCAAVPNFRIMEIDIDSAPGRGTTVAVTLPAATQNAAGWQRRARRRRSAPGDRGSGAACGAWLR